jgi:hypothetical protein
VKLIDHGFRSAFLPIYQKVRLRAEALHKVASLLVGNGYSVEGMLEGTAHMGPGLNFTQLFINPASSNMHAHLMYRSDSDVALARRDLR